jgi:Phosphotransferase enzyme family
MSSPPSKYWTNFTQQSRYPDRVVEALKILNFSALCEAASALSGELMQCTLDPTKFAYGGENIILELQFQNTFWIARILVPNSRYPCDGKACALENEVATLRYIRENTTIPVPFVYGYDADFKIEVGMPYILMEAMPGCRRFCGYLSGGIPETHIEKVYRQIADILVQLHSHPFNKVGMLVPDPETGSYRVGKIVDPYYRISPYGPFETSLDFYQTRAKLLNNSRDGFATEPIPEEYIPHQDEPELIPFLVDPHYNSGPFYLTHPDFAINNFLFDDDFNISGLVDWSGCQTMPLESFANPPDGIIPFPDEVRFVKELVQEGHLSPERRATWIERRRAFVEYLRSLEIERTQHSPIADMMESYRSYNAFQLDREGLHGLGYVLAKEDMAEIGWPGQGKVTEVTVVIKRFVVIDESF